MSENRAKIRDINLVFDRKTAKARMVTLFQDQEDRIKELSERYNVNLRISTLLREGFDSLLDEVESELKKRSRGE